MKKHSSSFSRITDVYPYQPDPYILDNISYPHELEPHCRISGSRLDTALIFKSIARFDAETFPVSLLNSQQAHRRLADGVCKVFNSVFSVLSFAVDTDCPYIKRDVAVFLTAHCINGFIASASFEQLSGATLFPANDNRCHERNSEGFQPAYDRDAEKTPVDVKAGDPEIQTAYSVWETGDNRNRGLITQDSDYRYCDTLIFSDNVNGGVRIEGACTRLSLTPDNVRLFLMIRSAVIRDEIQVDGNALFPIDNAGRQTRLNRPVYLIFQIIHIIIFFQMVMNVRTARHIPHCPAGIFHAVPCGGSPGQYFKNSFLITGSLSFQGNIFFHAGNHLFQSQFIGKRGGRIFHFFNILGFLLFYIPIHVKISSVENQDFNSFRSTDII